MSKVAIIGSGPAGYTLALELAAAGVEVEIFEQEDSIGGAIYTGIPDFRMPKTFLTATKMKLDAAGVKVHFGERIDEEGFKKLCETYDRVVCAIGAQVENTFGFETGKGLLAGLTLLYDLNRNHNEDAYKVYKNAIVWGGGNVAMDCARALKRLVENVTIMYRRSEAEMPANKIEIRDAREEGVKIDFLENIKDINRDENGYVTGVHAVSMELGEPDESGRRSPHEVAGSDYDVPCDLVVMAIGQKVNLTVLDPGLKIGDTHSLKEGKVYIAGDAYTGPKTIGSAILEGKAVAKEILSSL